MKKMNMREIAAAAELSVETVRRLHSDARKARAAGTDTARNLPAPEAIGPTGALEWHPDVVDAWLAERAKPARKGAVPKSTIHNAIKELERGRTNAALRVLKGALQ